MTHKLVSPGQTLKDRARVAVGDSELQQALHNLDKRLHTARAVDRDHQDLKDRAAATRRETLADLDHWLGRLRAQLERLGAVVHDASTPAEARRVVLDVTRRAGARRVIKSKSMATEEIDLADALESAGIETVETDLGEFVVQVAGERPSHIITPVIHKTLRQVADVLSKESGTDLPVDRDALTDWVRGHLRVRFLATDVGVTGANFVAADTGTIVLVTNEGNARFCTALPRVHIVVMPVDKVIARFADLATLLPLLTMSATGQRLSNYVSMITGPRRLGEVDGPDELHVVFLDHARKRLLGTPYEEMLACIRCGACLNVCPVYRKVGGHAYDSVYTGPMGKVLTPLLSAGEDGRDLPFASSLCGACTEACPVEIPLADLLVRLRADLRTPGAVVTEPRPRVAPAVSRRARRPGEGFPWAAATAPVPGRPAPRRSRRGLAARSWARLWAHPTAYRATTSFVRTGARLSGRTPWRRRAPGLSGWTATRDAPMPAPQSFRAWWRERESAR